MAIRIVVDSSASLPQSVREDFGIGVVPLLITDGDTSYVEQDSADDVVAALLAGHVLSTSHPNSEAFTAEFLRGSNTGILAILISAKLSGCVNSALLAARQHDAAVEVMDSQLTGGALALTAMAAVREAENGSSIAEVRQKAQSYAAQTQAWFSVENLEYLRRGGRISAAAAVVGKALGVRPLLSLVDGAIELLGKHRSSARSRQALLEQAVTYAATLDAPTFFVHHVGDEAAAIELSARLQEQVPGATIYQSSLSAAVAVHTGPGTLAIVCGPRL